MRVELETRLKQLTEAGARARESDVADYADDVSSLSSEKREAWASFLCSIATTESIEDTLIEPIRTAFSTSAPILEYLDAHGADERRHHELLTGYVKRTFQYEKNHRSGSDVVVYGYLVPGFAKLGRFKPLYLLTALRFYEAFSLDFYQILKKLAVGDGLPGLVMLIQGIEKDELRHLAGLEALVCERARTHGHAGVGDRLAIRSLLQVLLFDIDIGPWALHNRRVRRNAAAIGIDPSKMGQDARAAAQSAIAMIARANQ